MRDRFRVRPATLRDLEVLVRQRHMMFEDIRHRRAKEHKESDDSYRKWAASTMKRRCLRCYLAISDDGKVAAAGCVWLRPRQPSPGRTAGTEPYLMSMYTEPGFRRKGLASLIVKEAVKWARSRGYDRMTLHASRMGRGVYAKLGWKRAWEMQVDL